MTWEELNAVLAAIADAEPGEVFMGRPDRWWANAHWRCINNHVSVTYLKSEALGRSACIADGCHEQLALTFPEDRDGPLVAPKRRRLLWP